jgi:hypothetical protein
MNIDLSFAFISLLLLGAFHGINPGMGWLFAVALGLQEQKSSTVWRALLPLALGHALAVGCVILLAGLIGLVIPIQSLRWGVAGVLVALGLFHLLRHRHPRFGGMKIGARDLTIWSFLMASAHGAGLMVLPFLFGSTGMPAQAAHGVIPAAEMHHVHAPAPGVMPKQDAHAMTEVRMNTQSDHAGHATALLAGLPSKPAFGLLAALIHTIGYLLVVGLVAVIVYEKLGLRMLRKAWVNLDLIWAGTLIATAALTVAL